jgi:hypothetical protein
MDDADVGGCLLRRAVAHRFDDFRDDRRREHSSDPDDDAELDEGEAPSGRTAAGW